MPIVRLILFLVAAMLTNVQCGVAQDINRTNNWMFGMENGLQFSSTGVTVSNSSIVASEATASISDKKGNLLFYTDGVRVWNRNHQIMENGTGLKGRRQNSQPVLIVPNPQNESLYYIFTIGSYYGDLVEGPFDAPAVDHGLNYSVVDFSENTEGEVTEKNIPMLGHTALKMSAIASCSDNSYWLTTLSTANGSKGGLYNTFHSFKIDAGGVNVNAVTSTTEKQIDDPRGSMKFSPDGKKLAVANVTSRLLLCSFDTESGAVTYSRILSIKDFQTAAIAKWPYSVEFSMDGEILYTGSISDPNNEGETQSGLVQFLIDDFEAGSVLEKTVLTDDEHIFGSGLQLARDGKIYRAYSTYDDSDAVYLGIINNPTQAGYESNYQHDAKILPEPYHALRRSLPNFVPSFFHIENLVENISESKEILICEELDYSFSTEYIEGAEYRWFKDGVELEGENGYTLTIENVERNDIGHYELLINPNDGTCSKHKEAFVTKTVKLVEMPENLELNQCRSGVSQEVVFNLEEILNSFNYHSEEDHFNFYTSDPELNPNIAPLSKEEQSAYYFDGNDDIIYIEAMNKLGCSSFQSFTLNVVDASLPSLNNVLLCDSNDEDPHDGLALFQSETVTSQIISNNTIEDDITFSYFPTYEDALLETNQINEQAIPNDTKFWIRGERTGSDCLGISQITFEVIGIPKVELNDIDNIICMNPLTQEVLNPIVLGRNLGQGYGYRWVKDGTTQISETPTIEITAAGSYKVEITDTSTGCSYFSNEVEVTLSSIPVNDPAWLEIEQSPTFSDTNNVNVTAYGLGNSVFTYQLDDGPVNNDGSFSDLSTGGHIITIANTQGCSWPLQVPIYVIGFPNFFTPNNDGYNDFWNIDDPFSELEENDVLIYDRYGKLVAQINTSQEGWDGTSNGKVLMSNDYWFEIKLPNGNVYRDHFSLVR